MNFRQALRVIDAVPDVKNIQTRIEAPYYKLDVDGKIYMQVLQKGNGSVPKCGDKIYFRFDGESYTEEIEARTADDAQTSANASSSRRGCAVIT